MSTKHHICVCICTYQRPLLLANLLAALDRQETEGLFEYSIVIVDNDHSGSGRQTVESHKKKSINIISYYIEPEQNIALARNRAIANSNGNFVAFIDDDELPNERWLLNHYKALIRFGVAGVLGPVLPRYESMPPKWVLKGRFFERSTHPSGFVLDWESTRTGNCLFSRPLFNENSDWFHPQFGSGGEDRDFFKRKIARGHVFVWNNDAPVFEVIRLNRWAKKSMLKRALLRGKMSFNSDKHRPAKILGSLAAVLFYSHVLPFLFIFFPIFGYDVFMKNLITDFDHLGKLFALFRIDLVRERYII